MGNVKLQQGGVYIITTQGGSSSSPRSLTGTEEIFEKTFLEGINNSGSMKIGKVRSISTAGTSSNTFTDTNILIDTTAGSAQLNLLSVVGHPGQILNIKKIGGTNLLTINPSSTQTIDGALTIVTSDASASIQLLSTGAQPAAWYILSTYGTWT
jgi:hypothetical protein